MTPKQAWTRLAINMLLALSYFGAGKLGLMLAFVNPSATAVWPPTGIALAAFMLAGWWAWPGILVGALLVNLTTSASVPASLMIAVGNTLEGLLAAYLVLRFAHGTKVFDRGTDILSFALLAGLLSTTVSPTFGVTALVLNGLAPVSAFGQIWVTWWLGDAGGALVVAPVILLWALERRPVWGRRGLSEAFYLLAASLVLGLVVFSGLSPLGQRNYSLEFVLLPVVAWAALRFGQREAASVTFILALIAISGTLQGFGPFARVSPNEALLLLQTFMGALSVMGTGLAAVVAERKHTDASLREANDKLVEGLNELERRTREMAALNTMTDLLQSCLTVTEAYAVLTQATPKMFPGRAGGLYILSTSQNLVEAAAVWGDHPPTQRLFPPDDCWALRRGRMHLWTTDNPGLVCAHVAGPSPRASLCLPMIAQGEILGILHLQSMVVPDFPEPQLNLAQAVADSVALALANLRLRESLRQQSIRDPLTDLYNRRYLEEALERELLRAGRNQTRVGVIMLDIDNFKQFNDRFGHSTGDLLLRELGSFLKRGIRGGDIACRYGGEEFVLLLPDTTLDILQERAEQVRKEARLLQIPDHGDQALSITLSLGVSIYPQHGGSGGALLQVADRALYRAKSEGRDRMVLAET